MEIIPEENQILIKMNILILALINRIVIMLNYILGLMVKVIIRMENFIEEIINNLNLEGVLAQFRMDIKRRCQFVVENGFL